MANDKAVRGQLALLRSIETPFQQSLTMAEDKTALINRAKWRTPEHHNDALREVLAKARTYSVGAEVIPQITAMAETIPAAGGLPNWRDFSTLDGFIWLDSAVPDQAENPEAGVDNMTGLAWSIVNQRHVGDDKKSFSYAVILCWVITRPVDNPGMLELMDDDTNGIVSATQPLTTSPMYWPMDLDTGEMLDESGASSPFDEEVYVTGPDSKTLRSDRIETLRGDRFWADRWEEAGTWPLRLILATVAFSEQVVAAKGERQGRSVRRQADRAGLAAGRDGVRYVELRKTARQAGDSEAAGEGGSLSVRFAVRGHWRLQPYGPGRTLRKRIWIDGHMKGPEGAPVLDIEKVYRVRR